MRVAETRIEGFGRLTNLSLRFSPGLNLVFGPNEAGKSTLQQALLALLYGFDAESEAEAFRPWGKAAAFAGSLTYALDDGHAFRLTRRFLPNADLSIATYPEGDDITARWRGGEGRTSLAEEQWGLDRRAFASICVVRQGALEPVADPTAVVEALRRRLVTAPADASVARATGILETALKERVGAPHNRTKPLAQALARLARLQDERQHAVEVRRSLVPRLAELRQAAQRLAQLEARRVELQRRKIEAEEIAARSVRPAAAEVSAEIKRCEAELLRWQAWSTFPVHLRDTLLRLSAQHAHLREDCALAERRGRRAQESLAVLEAQEASLKERLAARQSSTASSSSDFVRLQTLVSEWRMACELEWSANERQRGAQPSLDAIEQRLAEERKALDPVLPVGLAGLTLMQERLKQARQRLAQAKGALTDATAAWARVGMEESDFRRLDQAVQQFRAGSAPEVKVEPRQGRRWLSGLLGRGQPEEQAPAGLATYAEIQPIYAEMARCRAEVDEAQRALSDIEATTLWQLGKLLGGTLDDSAFVQLRARLEEHLKAEAALEQHKLAAAGLRAEVEQARERRERAQAALQAELARHGFTSSDLHQALADYARQAEHRDLAPREDADQERTRQRMETELELLHARAEAQRIEVERWHEKQQALADVEAQIGALLTQAGIAARMDALDAAIRTFDEGVENYRRWERARAALDTATRYEQAIREASLRDASGRPPSPEAAAAREAAAELEALNAERSLAAEEHRRLEAEVQQMMVGVRHLAEIDEEIAQEQANIRRLEEFRDSLELARGELAEAALEFHAQFGPRLEALVREGLKQVSQGRFADAVIDPDSLALSLPAHEPGALLSVPRLGAGLRDLVYLVLRTSIARLMCGYGERLPILLDEPLAQCDQARQAEALEYLAQLAEETQVFLFTRDERLRARFEQRWGDVPRHQLHVLAA